MMHLVGWAKCHDFPNVADYPGNVCMILWIEN